MKFFDVKQGTDAWLNIRVGKITASRMKDVLAASSRTGKPLKAREDYKRELVVERLIGLLGKKEVYITPEMAWGSMNESLARTQYRVKTGRKVTEEGFCQHDELMVGVSTDGFVNDEGNLEIKCLTTHNHLYEIIKHGELPDAYRDQVQTQLWITERQWCDFVGYDSRLPSGLDLFIVRVERDDEYIEQIKFESELLLKEVDKDFAHFLKYLPIAERLCYGCGLLFTDKLSMCPDCKGSRTEIKTILQEAEMKMV